MHTGHHYTLKEFVLWTRRDIYVLLVLAVIPTALYIFGECKWLAIPWVPVALIGTAAAFLVGFKNTQTYNRLWEARQIWGGIVNTSRAWGIMAKHYVTGNAPDEELQQIHRTLIYRHIAWLTALRFQMREPRSWENITKPHNAEYAKLYPVDEQKSKLEEVIGKYLSEADKQYVLRRRTALRMLSVCNRHS